MKRLLAWLVLVPLAPAAQTTLYIDVNGTPPGTGTLADPYTSIQYAIDQPTTLGGERLWVKSGTYVENIDFDFKSFELYGRNGPDFCILRAAGPGPVVRAADGIVDGFAITGCMTPGVGAVDQPVGGGALTIQYCLIYDNAGKGALLGSDNTLFQTTLTGNAEEGIYMPNPARLTIRETIAWNNGAPPILKPFGIANNVFKYNNMSLAASNLGVYLGPGNIDEDPLFWDPANVDYRLRPGSPCADTGSPGGPPDPDGSISDMGVYTYSASYAPGPIAYCAAQVNSMGCTPAIGASGAPSAAGAQFDITCSNVLNQKSGLLFYGYAPKASPFQGGTLCVQAPVKRTLLQSAGGSPAGVDCTGVYSYDFDARIQSGIDPALVPGALVYAQYWYRDPLQAGAFTTGRSEGLRFGIRP